MASGLETSSPRPAWALSAPAARRFLLPFGVAAISLAAAAFLLHQLMAWPPHEDETLALFVGRDSLRRGRRARHARARRSAAPLPRRLGGCPRRARARRSPPRFGAFASPRCRSSPCSASASRAGGWPLLAPALAAASWIFLFHGVYGRMYSLFLFLSLLSYVALLRAPRKEGGRAGPAGSRRASPPWPRIPTARSSSPHRVRSS